MSQVVQWNAFRHDQPWIKSSRSYGNGACVEVRHGDAWTEVRDSKEPHGSILRFKREQWQEFVAYVKAGKAVDAGSPVRVEDGWIIIEKVSESSADVRLGPSQYRLARMAAAKEIATGAYGRFDLMR